MKAIPTLLSGCAAFTLGMLLVLNVARLIDMPTFDSTTQPITTEIQPTANEAPSEPVLIACYSGLDC